MVELSVSSRSRGIPANAASVRRNSLGEKKAQPGRPATPERRAQPTRTGTPQRRSQGVVKPSAKAQEDHLEGSYFAEDSVCSTRSSRSQCGQSTCNQASTTTKKWKPQLTVARGPTCSDPDAMEKRRSISRQRHESEADATGEKQVHPRRSGCSDAEARPSSSQQRQQVQSDTKSEKQVLTARPATPERRVQSARTGTPQRRVQTTDKTTSKPQGSDLEEKRAQRARQAAIQKSQEQLAQRREHCIFRKSLAESSAQW